MMIAVPPMKPVMVECDKKSTNIPNLKNPIANWNRPVMRVAVKIK
jgi:hypothetical protein